MPEPLGPEFLEPIILVYWIGYVFMLSVLLAIALTAIHVFTDRLPLILVPVLPVLVLVAGSSYSWLKYRSWSFELQSDGLHLSRGVIINVDTHVPYIRIQHIDTQRGPVDRLLGISSAVIYTAGSRGADVLIPGLKKQRAAELQDQLRGIIKEEEYRLMDAV